jgi:hypothetical protein
MTTRKFRPLEFVAFFVKSRGRREQLRFLPKCAGRGKVLFDVAKANIAVTDNNGGSLGRPRREGGRNPPRNRSCGSVLLGLRPRAITRQDSLAKCGLHFPRA